MRLTGKQLSSDQIEQSDQICRWLAQFPVDDRLTAQSLLSHIQFISRDEYADWLLNKLDGYKDKRPIAIYAVRKFLKEVQCLWGDDESVQQRPADTQGSEDFVASVIAMANKRNGKAFLDHSSLSDLRANKVRHILLVDDSIGSGKRVADFVRMMTNSPTFLSWWSYGLVTIHILSYARTYQATDHIMDSVPGDTHRNKKRRLSEKVVFDSDVVYCANDLHSRWGSNRLEILRLCDSITQIHKDNRRGFGRVMGNLVFYHSVPNNIPGCLYSSQKGWIPLFPNRSIPEWMISLLDTQPVKNTTASRIVTCKLLVPDIERRLLENIKRGLRKRSSLAKRLDCDVRIVSEVVDTCMTAGLVTAKLHLTRAGYDLIVQESKEGTRPRPNDELYIPQSWCVGRGTVQPSDHDCLRAEDQTDSTDDSFVDGDGGESSLEKTDAKATSSPMEGGAIYPSGPRDRSTLHGPLGLRSR